MTPTQFRETHPWLMAREQSKRQRARRRLIWRASLAAAAGFSIVAALAVVVT